MAVGGLLWQDGQSGDGPSYNAIGLAQFRGEVLGPLSLVPAGAAILFLYATADGNRLANWVPMIAFAAAWVATLLARWLGDVAAAVTLTVGLAFALSAAIVVYPGTSLAGAFAVVVAIASLAIGPRVGVFTAAGATGAVLTLRPWIAEEAALTAVVLAWVIAVLFWLATRPVYVALGWAWSSYLDGLRKTEELRDRQEELGRLSKSLEETCIQLDVLNRELERARLAAEESRRLKNEFAAAVSHELRTPLNLIIGFSEIMVISPGEAYDEPLPLSYRSDIQAVYRSACHISNLIDDILDLSQIDAHRMALRKESISLATVVESATASLESLFRDKGLWLEVDLPEGLPTVYADPTRVGQILTNLLANAARCTDRGGVSVSVTSRDHELVISVADTGVGIDPASLPHIFDTFRRVGEREQARAGHGLGLAISKHFVELHGGSMWVASRPDEGTIFSFSLPLQAEVIASVGPVAGKTWLGARVNGGLKTIVALDGDGYAARILGRYLAGYRVIQAATVAELRRIVARESVRAVIRTASSRDLDRERDLANDHRLDQILMVDCPFEMGWAGARELGVADYLVKPVTSAQLRRAIRRLGRKPGSVLVIDDDVDVVRLLAKMIRTTNRSCQVWEAFDGWSGLEILRTRRPDLVLLDLLLPGLNGNAILEAMRADPALHDTRVIVISARGREYEAVMAGSIGIHRPGGLGIGEAMRCLEASLGVLLAPGPDSIVPGQPVGLLD